MYSIPGKVHWLSLHFRNYIVVHRCFLELVFLFVIYFIEDQSACNHISPTCVWFYNLMHMEHGRFTFDMQQICTFEWYRWMNAASVSVAFTCCAKHSLFSRCSEFRDAQTLELLPFGHTVDAYICRQISYLLLLLLEVVLQFWICENILNEINAFKVRIG